MLSRLHPANWILCWLLVACWLHVLQPTPLVVSVSLLILLALYGDRRRWWRTLKRLRFLLFALVVVYGWSTPGMHVMAQSWAPSEEGLLLGALQALRLMGMLASLQLLMAILGRDRLFGGLYTLAAPLALFGLSRQRCALRLALTMDFAEALLAAPRPARDAWRAWLDGAGEEAPAPIRLSSLPFVGGQRWCCAVLLGAIGLILMGAGY
ncbi:hypothetical protein JHS3_11750 [Jeongeupia sp. HS-3]|uniref:CbiQ family ECF transporter T component n=1 Tax=Jeongeupia sp. HS-3 TaxID=1009682 RepID=UPI0018A34161|nr:CbiQ family ECF transporter T component [Jeongeupia sp. HS-3]BCL75439.1 hypothetical protein JHS3_11750 [Jeongeupia sp. HS-3]